MLKLGELYPEIQKLAGEQVTLADDRAARRDHALTAFAQYAARPDWWRQRAAAADTKLHLCALGTDPAASVPAPPAPDDYTVVATDGSQIYPDRHGAAVWFVVNTGEVVLRYGEDSGASLNSVPRLFADERDVFRGLLGQRQSVTAEEVSVVRTVEELRALLALVQSLDQRPALALLDGKLMPWSWVDGGFKEHHLQLYAELVGAFRELGVPLASYVSRSGANEVTNLVRIGDCDQPRVHCTPCPHLAAVTARTGSETMTVAEAQALPCGKPAGLVDADLFGRRLAPFERSAVFVEDNRAYERVHQRAAFFYLSAAGDEIGRVELPDWAAADGAVVDFVHAVVADQIVKGQGYPVALREAHEQAVVRSPDRQAFLTLLERALVQHHSIVRHSLKSRAKQVPGV